MPDEPGLLPLLFCLSLMSTMRNSFLVSLTVFSSTQEINLFISCLILSPYNVCTSENSHPCTACVSLFVDGAGEYSMCV